MITAILDDDPTGTQAMSGVSVILDWLEPKAWGAVQRGDTAVHLLTNSRAHDHQEAARLVRSAATAARARFPDCRLLLRGDSTLRAHLWEEYEALRSVVRPGRSAVPLMLVPALPAAGRVTIAGVHLLERDGERVPLDHTEYARDGGLAYTTSQLAHWAEERSDGRFAAAHAIHVPLAALRTSDGSRAVADALATAATAGHPAVVVPDCETDQDLEVIAEGFRSAEVIGVPALVRSAPSFAAVLTGSYAAEPPDPPSGACGVLVLCGSFVSQSTAQIKQLEADYPGTTVEVRAATLAGDGWAKEVRRVSDAARTRIDQRGVVCVSTERIRDPALTSPASQQRTAFALAQVARHVDAGVVVAKGGITSAVTARDGLDAYSARVLGPVKPGVAFWRLNDGRNYLVVPGNVGGPNLLADLVASIVPASRDAANRTC